jgi:UDP-N-acetylglucosamine--N-acetylmuramyl-(pentapeptide) pyrophosphoryl-undecaprenol N-acetylglucosamine transferase
MMQVLHQTGSANFAEVERLSQAALMNASYENRYLPMSWLDDQTMRLAISAADVVFSRSGSSIFELAAFRKPMILVPHPGQASNDHQSANAHAFERVGAAIVIEETNLFPGIFLSEMKRILGDDSVRNGMSSAAGGLVTENSAELIAQEILKAAE